VGLRGDVPLCAGDRVGEDAFRTGPVARLPYLPRRSILHLARSAGNARVDGSAHVLHGVEQELMALLARDAEVVHRRSQLLEQDGSASDVGVEQSNAAVAFDEAQDGSDRARVGPEVPSPAASSGSSIGQVIAGLETPCDRQGQGEAPALSHELDICAGVQP
jgi:hypothetical protein